MKTIGLYIHIPFCRKKCHYCDFNSFETLELIPRYLDSLKKEISNLKGSNCIAKTIYIGGGTPTILTCSQLVSLFTVLNESIPKTSGAEITIEANPGTLAEDKLNVLKSMGVNRLSIGLQAYQDNLLKIMGRIHTAKDFEKNFILARKIGFNNINVDLIFGVPNQKPVDFENTIKNVLDFSPEHLSCYSLSVEKGTKFYEGIENKTLHLPPEEDERLMYYKVIEILTSRGYKHYEISNFAITGYESKHNKIYWTYGDYLGLGAGAHSFLNNVRLSNHSSIEAYIDSITKTSSAIDTKELISTKEQQAEFCFLGLRLLDGLDGNAFKQRFGKEIAHIYGDVIEKLKKQGLLEENSDRIMLTDRGLDFANAVFVEFLT